MAMGPKTRCQSKPVPKYEEQSLTLHCTTSDRKVSHNVEKKLLTLLDVFPMVLNIVRDMLTSSHELVSYNLCLT